MVIINQLGNVIILNGLTICIKNKSGWTQTDTHFWGFMLQSPCCQICEGLCMSLPAMLLYRKKHDRLLANFNQSLACSVLYCLIATIRLLVAYSTVPRTAFLAGLACCNQFHGDPALLQGVWLRDYEPVNQRQDTQTSVKETLGEVKPSNAYKRRVAGTNWQ